ncbi:hypothetical protein GH714_018566 [Hevea brasiliensis]|uniref:Uncharacterized protein n=1 Tax=Hevea brasiliensis TaxID=3981 RepID=A0A6A6L0C3_HEVBR|nr:hypothetical protein GH714_018566 [Hevea brasiliensis]
MIEDDEMVAHVVSDSIFRWTPPLPEFVKMTGVGTHSMGLVQLGVVFWDDHGQVLASAVKCLYGSWPLEVSEGISISFVEGLPREWLRLCDARLLGSGESILIVTNDLLIVALEMRLLML